MKIGSIKQYVFISIFLILLFIVAILLYVIVIPNKSPFRLANDDFIWIGMIFFILVFINITYNVIYRIYQKLKRKSHKK